MATAESASIQEAVLTALREVSDPELDESLVDLGFVDGVRVDGARVQIALRLPTFWCAPNFAYLMANDARQAALGVPGVREVHVALKDHMYSDEITAGVSCGESFAGVFGDQADGDDIGELRALFRNKAFGMRQEQLVRFLLDAGVPASEIVQLRVRDVDRLVRGAAPLAQVYLERRRRVGLSNEDNAILVTTLDGAPVSSDGLEAHLQALRRQRISMTFNALMCRGLLQTRYGIRGVADESSTTVRV
jgi:metal-sulfur cluster biosynthetic enzyme